MTSILYDPFDESYDLCDEINVFVLTEWN